jgi:hypothetical protein
MSVKRQSSACLPLNVRHVAVKDVLPARSKSGNASGIVSVPFSLIKIGMLSTNKATRPIATMVLGASRFRAFALNVNIHDLKRDIAIWSGHWLLCTSKVAAMLFFFTAPQFTLSFQSIVPLSESFTSALYIGFPPLTLSLMLPFKW